MCPRFFFSGIRTGVVFWCSRIGDGFVYVVYDISSLELYYTHGRLLVVYLNEHTFKVFLVGA